MSRLPKTVNWEALKVEWLQSDETLNKFRLRKGLSNNHFYDAVNKQKWVEQKRQPGEKTTEKVMEKVSKQQVEEWVNQKKLWHGVEVIAAKILTKYNNGELAQNPHDLSALTCAIERSLKSRKLILGEATETIESRNLYMGIQKIVEDCEDENRRIDMKNMPKRLNGEQK